MGDIVVYEEVDQFGQIFPVFDQQQKRHFSVDEFSGDSVEIYFDGELLLAVAYGVDCLGRVECTL